MKILWLCNVSLPEVARIAGFSYSPSGGWIEGLYNELAKDSSIELYYATVKYGAKELQTISLGDSKHYIVPAKKGDLLHYSAEVEDKLRTLLQNIKPDVVHIFGTEYPHSLAMVKACSERQKIVINIQGLVSVIANHYTSGLPAKVQQQFALRDYIKNRNILKQIASFRTRGKYEEIAIKSVNHAIGRTTWDNACVHQINPDIHYYSCNEILRSEFYNYCWELNKVEQFSIFVSQGGYPVKGLHFLLQALPLIKARFPNTKVYIAGADISKRSGVINRLKLTSYGQYIGDLIRNYNLGGMVEFLGFLSEKEMCDRFLISHVFVSASIIENESNSVSEAKILGVPVVSSYVGGVIERINHNVSGLLYQHDSINMLAHSVCRIFADDDLAITLSKNARLEALITNDKVTIVKEMTKIYGSIK